MYLWRTPVVLLQMVATTTEKMADGIVIVLLRFVRLKHNQCLKAKARVFTTLIVPQLELQVQLPCVAVIPVMGDT